jgi:GTP-binding protein
LDISEGSSSQNPVKDFQALNQELNAYHPSLREKTQFIALNKIDVPAVREKAQDVEIQFRKMGYRLFLISGKTGEGVENLMEAVAQALESVSRPEV